MKDLGESTTRQEVALSTFLMWYGVAVGSIGTYMSISGGFSAQRKDFTLLHKGIGSRMQHQHRKYRTFECFMKSVKRLREMSNGLMLRLTPSLSMDLLDDFLLLTTRNFAIRIRRINLLLHEISYLKLLRIDVYNYLQ